MKKTFLLAALSLVCMTSWVRADETPDYTKGVLFLNEDWFGHQNGSMNYLRPDGSWDYRVFQKENPGMELGSTTQYGVIHGDKMYIVSKQVMESSTLGARITVCDAKTLKCLKQIKNIATDNSGKSIADGRAFVGIDAKKGYISASNGIYVFDLEKLEITGMIPGTGSDDGGLYTEQCGVMLKQGNKVFAVHQKKGLLVIDAENDMIQHTIAAPVEHVNGKATQRGFGAVVQSKDSSLWLSVAADLTGRGNTVDYFFRLDPKTLDTTRIALPAGYGLPISWYAWTADAFCASTQQNKLYWKKKSDGLFTSSVICCYDIDKNECTDFFDSQTLGWYIYCGAGFRVHPQTDEMYVSLYRDNLKQEYQTLRLDAEGKVLATYEMINHYWFPAMIVFPSASAVDTPGVSETFTFDDVKMWVGEGANRAALVVDWNSQKKDHALVWGYRWDGEANGYDMLAAIAKADPRFVFLSEKTAYGNAVAGLGYNENTPEQIKLIYGGEGTPQVITPIDGMAWADSSDYGNWSCSDSTALWQAEHWSVGYWSYYVKDKPEDDFGYAQTGPSDRKLVNGSVDGYSFAITSDPATGAAPRTPYEFVLPYKRDTLSNVSQMEVAVAKVYPNPTTDVVNVEVPEKALLEVFDMSGRLLLRRPVAAGMQTIRLDKSGLYFLRLTTQGKIYINRLIRR